MAKNKKKKVFRSIEEVRKHYFPKSYEEEQLQKKMQDPKEFGTELVKDLMDGVSKELKKELKKIRKKRKKKCPCQTCGCMVNIA